MSIDLRTAHLEPVETDPDAERARRKTDLARSYRLFGSLRWGSLGDGHITARDPERLDHFWVLQYGVPFGAATEDDLVLVNPTGDVVEGQGRVNRAGYHIHHPIHAARPDIVAAAHTHTPWGTPFAAEARLFEPITQESTIFFEDQALFDDDEVQVLSTDCGERIAKALGDNTLVVLRNHGLLTVGASVAEAIAAFVIAERVAEAHLKARNPKPISPEAARQARDDLTSPGAMWRNYLWLVSA